MIKRIVLLVLVMVCLVNHHYGQLFKVKTIYQYLQVADTKVPISNSLPAPKNSEAEEFLKVAMDDDVNNGQTGLADMKLVQKYLADHPAGKNMLKPEKVFYLSTHLSHDNELQYTGSSYQLLDSLNHITPLPNIGFVAQDKYDYLGFNALDDKGAMSYYDYTGQKIFDSKFQFVATLKDGFYRFYEGKKAGVVDRAGKILLPAIYDHVLAFLFHGKPWFGVKEKDKEYFLEYGNPKPVLKTQNINNLPEIAEDRYWVLDGHVYDMVSRVELFTTIKQKVELAKGNKAVFYIEQEYKTNFFREDGSIGNNWNEQRIYFDVKGNLLLGQPILSRQTITNNSWVGIVKGGDTLIKGVSFILKRHGIMDTSYKWIKAPEYAYMNSPLETGYVSFAARLAGDDTKLGLMDHQGKVVIPEGRYQYFGEGGLPGKLVCYKKPVSDLWDAAANTFTPLDKAYFSLRGFGLAQFGLLKGISGNNHIYILDTSGRLLDTTTYADIYTEERSGLIRCFPFRKDGADYYNEKIYFTPAQKRVQFSFDGATHDTFMDIDSLAPGAYLYTLKSGKNIVQTRPGEYFYTTCEYMQYDPFFNWYIGHKPHGDWGLISAKGDSLTPFIFRKIERYSMLKGSAQLESNDGHLLQLDAAGNRLFDGKYESVEALMNGYFIVSSNGSKGLLHRSGKEVIPVKYPYLEIMNGLIFYGDDFETASSMKLNVLKGE